MRKLKLCLIATIALFAIGMQTTRAAAIDYLTGWTEVTSLPTSSDINDYYYVFVATEADLMVAEEVNSTQNTRLAPVYRIPSSPLTCKRMVWSLEYDASHGYGIRNLHYNTYLLQTNTDSPWQIHAWYETNLSSDDWTKWIFSYDAETKWTIQNGKYPTFDSSDCYWGPWNSKTFRNGEPMAGNKADDNIGHFKIYQILRTTYNTMVSNKVITSTYITNPSFEANGSVVAETSTTSSASGWSFNWSGHTNSNAVNGIATKGTKYGSIGANVEASEGTYFMAIRLRWDEKSYTANTSQELTLPKGRYLLNADYRAWTKQSSATLTFAALGGGGTLATTNGTVITGASSFNDVGFETLNLPFTTSTSSVTIKFTLNGKQNTQAIYDNVNLIYTANYTESLKSAIDRATALNTRSETTALSTAITTAQGVLDGVTDMVGYQSNIDEAVDDLNDAIATAWAALKGNLSSGEDITYIVANPSFESSTPVSGGVVTTIADAFTNGTYFGNMQPVGGWTITANGDNHAAGVYEYGSTPWLGGSGYTAPATDPNEKAGNALGIIAVWTATSQYTQSVTLPSGRYTVSIPIYNKTRGTTSFSKNLFGFIEDGGTEHLASAKTYSVDTWTTETVSFDLDRETSGKLSLGYTSANKGSNDMPHLFVDGITITYTSASNYYASKQSLADEYLNDGTYTNVTGTERTSLYNAAHPVSAPSTVAEYFSQSTAIDEALATFTAAKSEYDRYAAEKANADRINTSIASGISAPTTADGCDAVINSILVAEYSYVNDNFSADATDGYSLGLDTWTFTGTYNGGTADTRGTNNNEHWSGSARTYYEQGANGWGANSWVANYTKTVTLPAATYVLRVAARGSTNTTASMSVTIGGNTYSEALPSKGGATKGITTEGIASFGDGEFANTTGRGWQWRYLAFTLADETEVTFNFDASTSGNHEWFSICDLALKSDISNVSVTVTSAGFATYVPSYNLDFSETDIKAYKVKVSDKGVATLTQVDEVPANTPVLLHKAGGATENIPVIASADAVSDNDLVAGTGAAVATTDGEYTNMILNNVSGIGFYYANNQIVATNRAYLHIATGLAPDRETGSRMVMVFADETTGISSHTPSLSPKGEGSVYTLSGQRVETPKKGLYIKNGKKVIIK